MPKFDANIQFMFNEYDVPAGDTVEGLGWAQKYLS